VVYCFPLGVSKLPVTFSVYLYLFVYVNCIELIVCLTFRYGEGGLGGRWVV
jgi:hypothetical protein